MNIWHNSKILFFFQAGLRAALVSLKNDLPWVERLDITTDLAPISTAMQLEAEAEISGIAADEENAEGDDVHNDFKRELTL